MLDKESTGKLGEQIAADYLKERGYEILDRNWKNDLGRRMGEIDIVAKEKKSDMLVFVEVKTREFERYQNTLPEENITVSKLKKLSRIASAYLFDKRLEIAGYRFDAVSVWIGHAGKALKIKHIESL